LGELNAELPSIPVDEAAHRLEEGALVLDVRSRSEYDAGHIAGALHSFYGRLPSKLDTLPQDRPILIICASGSRSQIAASLLMKHGFSDFASVQGGLDAWKAAGLPVTTD
jgi:hydroxyacylglutathione hydrolase